MPPRRRSQAAPTSVSLSCALASYAKTQSASPGESSGTTLVQALEHLPPVFPKIEAESEDDLTPPPDERIPNEMQDLGVSVKKRKRASAKITTYAEASEPEEATKEAEKKARKGAKKAVMKAASPDEAFEDEGNHLEEDREEEEEKPKKKKATPKKKKVVEGDEEAEEKPKKRATPKKSRLAKDEPQHGEDGNEIVKKKRKPKEYPKIEYEIPPVEKKETTFRGDYIAR